MDSNGLSQEQKDRIAQQKQEMLKRFQDRRAKNAFRQMGTFAEQCQQLSNRNSTLQSMLNDEMERNGDLEREIAELTRENNELRIKLEDHEDFDEE